MYIKVCKCKFNYHTLHCKVEYVYSTFHVIISHNVLNVFLHQLYPPLLLPLLPIVSLPLCVVPLQPFYTTRVNAADIDTRVRLLDQMAKNPEENPGEKSKAGFWEEFDVGHFVFFFALASY